MINPAGLIVLPRLQVQNANAISGPLTWGFPSPTAFTGFAHALERRLMAHMNVSFGGVGIVCHKFEPQVYKPGGKYTQVFQLPRNPLGKDGKTAAIVEEGRAHMEVSLVLTVLDYLDEEDSAELIDKLMDIVHTQRLAGGSLLPSRIGKRYQSQYWPLPQDKVGQDEIFHNLRRRLLPGFALVHRDDYLKTRTEEMRQKNEKANALDALMDLSRLNIEPDNSDEDESGETQWRVRTHPGWLVPIPIGYAAISLLYKAGDVANARDNETRFRFVENIYSIGEWVSPHRLTTLEQLLWHRDVDEEKGIYRCINHYAKHLIRIQNSTTQGDLT